jgi:hypothetical protein
MIKIRRSQIIEVISIYAISNTPLFLYNNLLTCSAVTEIITRESRSEMIAYYNKITSKAKQNLMTIALSYAVITAILFSEDHSGSVTDVDFGLLEFGEYIKEFAKTKPSNTTISMNAVNSTFNYDNAGYGKLIIPARRT